MPPCLPVLMYHHVNPTGNFINCTPDRFEAQVRYLSRRGYQSLTIKDLEKIINEGRDIPRRSIMITFDDGWLDNYFYAYPVLKKYGMKGVLFVVTSWVSECGRRKDIRPLPSHRDCVERLHNGEKEEVMVSWEELREMESSGVFDIQSHSHSHRRWDREHSELATCKEALRRDLTTARELIREHLGKTPLALCWPWGVYYPWYQEVAIEAGYRYLFTTEKGCNTLSDLKALKRIVIGNIGILDFRKKLLIHSSSVLSGIYLKIFGK